MSTALNGQFSLYETKINHGDSKDNRFHCRGEIFFAHETNDIDMNDNYLSNRLGEQGSSAIELEKLNKGERYFAPTATLNLESTLITQAI